MITADTSAVLAKARSQIGVDERPPYSNRTPYTAWYGLTGPWCAMFVSWVFWHAGHPLPPIRTRKGFAYCPDIVNWAKRNGTWRPSSSSYVPKQGDIVLFDFIGRPSHVGIVERMLPDGRVRTVEGNTNAAGSRTGGSVMSHSRNRRGSTVGYVEVASLVAVDPNEGRPFRTYVAGATDAGIYRAGGRDNQIAELQILCQLPVTRVHDSATVRAVVQLKEKAGWSDASGAKDRTSRVDERFMTAVRNLAG